MPSLQARFVVRARGTQLRLVGSGKHLQSLAAPPYVLSGRGKTSCTSIFCDNSSYLLTHSLSTAVPIAIFADRTVEQVLHAAVRRGL